MNARSVIIAIAIATVAMGPLAAGEYSQVKVVHTNAEGFSTVLQQDNGFSIFSVINGEATLVFKRDNNYTAPPMYYTSDEENTTLSLGARPEMIYICDTYYDTRPSDDYRNCNASCRPCICEVCIYLGGNSAQYLEYGPHSEY